ncbi:MAG: flagellar basal body rod protein FlgB [Legionellales bacterium]|nr:flagellar basal body rod protein FlgB [Legionellales bacterium]
MNGDTILGVHGQALLLREKRTAILSANMANASTPNYKAKDFNFYQTLQQTTGMTPNNAEKPISLATNRSDHLGNESEIGMMQLKYRIPHFPALDGNTVDNDLEQGAFADNALRYQASLNFLRNRVAGILTAIKGE